MKSKITFLTCAKNDNYYENYIERLEYTLNYNLFNIHLSGLENFVNIIFIDYGSSKSLSKSIKIYNNKYRKNVSFLKISKKELKKRFKSKNIIYFSPQVAHNLAAVHAKSEFIMWGSSDLLFSLESLRNLKNFLTIKNYNYSNKIFYCKRKLIDNEFYNKKYHTFNQLNNFFDKYHFSKHQFIKHHAHTGGGSGCMIMKTKEYIKNNGLDENIDKLNWSRNEVRFLHKINENYFVKDLTINGIFVYKFDYTETGLRKESYNNLDKNFLSIDKNIKKYELIKLKNFKVTKERLVVSSCRNFKFMTHDKFLDKTLRNFPKKSLFLKIYLFLKFCYNFSIIQNKNFKNYLILKNLIYIIKNSPILSFNLITNKKFNNIPLIISSYFKFLNIIYFDLKNSRTFEVWDNYKSKFNSNHLGQVNYLSNLLNNNQFINFSNFHTEQEYSNLLFLDIDKNINLNFKDKLKKFINKNSNKISFLFLSDPKMIITGNIKFKKLYSSKQFSIFINKKIDDKKIKNFLKLKKNDNTIDNLFSFLITYITSFLTKFLKMFKNINFQVKKSFKKKFYN